MPEVAEATYLSIGEVLDLLKVEFADITISKIRFLESQGLIEPERTSSGYRKFYSADVDLLRVILTEQVTNYLPLRVIKDRLRAGEIDPTGEHLRPAPQAKRTPGKERVERPENEDVPNASIASHPASRHKTEPVVSFPSATKASSRTENVVAEPQLLPGLLIDRDELCRMVGITLAELDELETFGVVTSRETGGVALYGEDAVTIARHACELLRLGIDGRHLRNWRTSAEREASLFEQLVTPRFRQRNPESRSQALAQLTKLDALGAAMRQALMRQALRHHFEA